MDWISVDERLPEQGVAVLVHGENDNPHYSGFDVCWIADGMWTAWWTKNITHWQPLPEPPKK